MSCFTTTDLHPAGEAFSDLALGCSFTFCILVGYQESNRSEHQPPKFSRVKQEAWSSRKQVLQHQFKVYCSYIHESLKADLLQAVKKKKAGNIYNCTINVLHSKIFPAIKPPILTNLPEQTWVQKQLPHCKPSLEIQTSSRNSLIVLARVRIKIVQFNYIN